MLIMSSCYQCFTKWTKYHLRTDHSCEAREMPERTEPSVEENNPEPGPVAHTSTGTSGHVIRLAYSHSAYIHAIELGSNGLIKLHSRLI